MQARESFADIWKHQRRVLCWFLLCFLAEVVPSWQVWSSTPYDSLRVGYPDFAMFEAGRLQFWALMLVMIGLTGAAMAWLANRDSRLSGSKENAKAKPLCLYRSLYLASAIALEIGTSVSYWIWNRAVGWPSFRPSFQIYLWEHLLPWVIVVSLGLFIWNRLAKGGLALYVTLFGLALVAVYFVTVPHCVCIPCVTVPPDFDLTKRVPLDQENHCHCASYANQLFQSAFGHNERHSETMTKSTGPCVAKN
jgi:hypothetical protein